MKYIRQFCIIMGVTFAAECLRYFIPLQIPASIYGLVIMFILLLTGVVKLEAVQETADFLIAIMPILFVPGGVALISSFGILAEMLVPFLVITVVSTFLVMAAAGWTTQAIIRRKKK